MKCTGVSILWACPFIIDTAILSPFFGLRLGCMISVGKNITTGYQSKSSVHKVSERVDQSQPAAYQPNK